MRITSRQALRLPRQRLPRPNAPGHTHLPHAPPWRALLHRRRSPRAAALCARTLAPQYLTIRPAGPPTHQSHPTAHSSERPAVGRCADCPNCLHLSVRRLRGRTCDAMTLHESALCFAAQPTWGAPSLPTCPRVSYMFLDNANQPASGNTINGVQLKACWFNAGGSDASCEAALRCKRTVSWDGSPQWWSAVQQNAPGASG